MFYIMFPSRTPDRFSCVLSKLAKFCSACCVLHIPECWLPFQGLEKKKKITEPSLKSEEHAVSFDGGCQRSSQGRVAPVLQCLLGGGVKTKEPMLPSVSLSVLSGMV